MRVGVGAPLLDEGKFRTVVAATPLVSIDLVVQREDGKILLGLRNNRPAQGCWFVPGGRVRKSETLDAAFARLTQTELGVALARHECRLLGVYEHFYEDSVFGEGDHAPSTHYVVLGYAVPFTEPLAADLPLEQRARYAWFEPAEVLSTEAVHPHSKAYIQDL